MEVKHPPTNHGQTKIKAVGVALTNMLLCVTSFTQGYRNWKSQQKTQVNNYPNADDNGKSTV